MQSDGCPKRSALEDYALGRLPSSLLERLSRHMEECPHCQAALAGFDEAAEELVDRLTGGAAGSPFADEAERERALAMAISVIDDPPPADPSPQATADHRHTTASQLGEYELLEPIGQGGMGTVFRGFHTRMNRVVAIKLLPRWCQQDERAIERFRREIAVVARLDHPNIVRAYDARETHGERFLVTEFVPGLNLSELVRRLGPLPVPDACELIRQAAVALEYVHAHDLIHRDVKPSNLMLADTGQVKLLDLGLAYVPGHAEELTDPGQMMGTIEYMAPEQASDSHDVDIRADVYGLGATLYKLLCGESPLGGTAHATPISKLQALTHGQVVSIHSRRPDLPDALAATIDRALCRQPEGRFATPQELGRALEPFCTGCDLRTLLQRAGREAPSHCPPDPSLVSTSRLATCADENTVSSQPHDREPVVQPLRRRIRWARLLGAAAAFIVILAGVIIVIRRNGQETRIHVPDKSQVRIDVGPEAEVRVDVQPSEGGAESQPLVAGRTSAWWGRLRYDTAGSSFYPIATQTRTSRQLELTKWNPDRWLGHVWSVATGDLTGDGFLEVVVRDADTIVAFDRWAKELWRRNPIVDSLVPIPPGRIGIASRLELADLDNDGAAEVLVVAGSGAPDGWSLKAPQRAMIYDGDGSVLRQFSILEGSETALRGCVDFNEDGFPDPVIVIAAYRHPHAVCIYDSVSGELLLRADFADSTEVGGVGDIDKDGQLDLYLLQSYTCHVDPPVADYDSDHCYATRYDRQGKRLWQQPIEADAADGGLVDVDGDGALDLVLLTDAGPRGELHLLDAKTGLPRYSFTDFAAPFCRHFSIADVTGDGAQEIVVGDGKELRIFDSQARITCRRPAPDTRVVATNDLDGDGQVEIVASQSRDLVVLDRQLEELARYTTTLPITEAIIGDIGGDGVNDLIVLGRDQGQVSLTAIHFAPRVQDEAGTHAKQPWHSVRNFLAKLRGADVEQALKHVPDDRRETIREQIGSLGLNSIPLEFEHNQSVHIDDARVVILGDPPILFTLQYADNQWWIVSLTTDE